MNRRGFLGAILAAAVAPAIVRASSLMQIVSRGPVWPTIPPNSFIGDPWEVWDGFGMAQVKREGAAITFDMQNWLLVPPGLNTVWSDELARVMASDLEAVAELSGIPDGWPAPRDTANWVKVSDDGRRRAMAGGWENVPRYRYRLDTTRSPETSLVPLRAELLGPD